MQNFIRRTAAALAVLCMGVLLLGTPAEAEETSTQAEAAEDEVQPEEDKKLQEGEA